MQIKISTLQDRTLRSREGGPLLCKDRNSTTIHATILANSVFFLAVSYR